MELKTGRPFPPGFRYRYDGDTFNPNIWKKKCKHILNASFTVFLNITNQKITEISYKQVTVRYYMLINFLITPSLCNMLSFLSQHIIHKDSYN